MTKHIKSKMELESSLKQNYEDKKVQQEKIKSLKGFYRYFRTLSTTKFYF